MPIHPMANVIPGIDIAATADFAFLKGATIGVLANQATVDRSGIHLVNLLNRSRHCKLAKLFAPEHGFLGAAQDMVSVPDENDNETGIEIISLYGETVESLSSLQPSKNTQEKIAVGFRYTCTTGSHSNPTDLG
ncbi:MAG: hypothetical protein ACI92G_002023 [Candidatus Pelagisphaera sp.]|jgi:uncharacterized protein YbbC (DUF1343 family)